MNIFKFISALFPKKQTEAQKSASVTKELPLSQKISLYEAEIRKNPGLPFLELSTYLFPAWDCETFIDNICLGNMDVYRCTHRNTQDEKPFYAFLAPRGYGGYLGFIVGGQKEIFLSRLNYDLELAPVTFVAPIENSSCRLRLQRGTREKSVFGYDGPFPELYAVQIILDTPQLKKQINIPASTYWYDIKPLVDKLEKELAAIR